jgi:hypothetical protein
MYVEVPILMCFPSVGNALGLSPSCNPPWGEPAHMGTSPTTKFPVNTGVKIVVRGREITVWYSSPKLVQLSWAPALCSWISNEQTYGDCGKNTSGCVSSQ